MDCVLQAGPFKRLDVKQAIELIEAAVPDGAKAYVQQVAKDTEETLQMKQAAKRAEALACSHYQDD